LHFEHHSNIATLEFAQAMTGEWPKDFTEITMIALKKKPQATKCSDHRTVSLIAHSKDSSKDT